MHAEARVDSFTTPLDAELAKAYLESHEIAVRLEGETLIGSAYALGPILGGIGLLVQEQEAPRARELLEQYHLALRRDAEGVADEQDIDGGKAAVVQASEDTPDQRVMRAFGLTLLAFILLPVVMHVYAIARLLRVPAVGLSPRARKYYVIAWVLNAGVLLVIAWFLVRAVA